MKRNIITLCISLIFVASSINSAAQVNFWAQKRIAKKITRYMKALNSEGLNERKMGSPDERNTALYLAHQLDKIGIDSLGDYAYLQAINVPTLRMAQAKTSLLINGRPFNLFSNFYPLSISANNGKYTGPAVSVGYGIDDATLYRTDYKNKEVTGKAVIIDLAVPSDQKNDARFAAWQTASDRVLYAKSKGAKAVLCYTSDPNFKPEGNLSKVIENSNIPVVFVAQDLSELVDIEVDLNIDILLLSALTQNVIGYIDNKAKTSVLITTHHDNTYTTYEDLKNSSRTLAAFLALAKEIKKNPKKFGNNNYIFASFTGYENQMLGAKYLLSSAIAKSHPINYMLSIDQISNLDSNQQVITINGLGTSSAFAIVPKEVMPNQKSTYNTQYGLDSLSESTLYYENNVPVLSMTAQSKSGKATKRVKAGRNESRTVSYLCELLAALDTKSAEYSNEKSTIGTPEKVLTKIPFTPLK
jgi:hypothetical protein